MTTLPFDPVPLFAPTSSEHGMRRQKIVESLLTEVVQGRLTAGQHLVTQELAIRFHVSHTPIREAFVALAGMGVIDLLPNRGAVVRRVRRRDVREICHVRRILECAAARNACGRFLAGELEELVKSLEKLKARGRRSVAAFIRQARELDNQLHDLIAQRCGNTFLGQEIGRFKMLYRVFRDVAWSQQARNDYRRLVEEADEHLAIVRALQNEDRSGAAKSMRSHIRAGERYWTRALPDG